MQAESPELWTAKTKNNSGWEFSFFVLVHVRSPCVVCPLHSLLSGTSDVHSRVIVESVILERDRPLYLEKFGTWCLQKSTWIISERPVAPLLDEASWYARRVAVMSSKS